MGSRAGADCLESLRDAVASVLNGSSVWDVRRAPRFMATARTIAELLEMQHGEYEGELTCSSETSGARVEASYLFPRNKEQLVFRRKALDIWADATHGMMAAASCAVFACTVAH